MESVMSRLKDLKSRNLTRQEAHKDSSPNSPEEGSKEWMSIEERAIKRSWQNLLALMTAADEGRVIVTPTGRASYHEIRAIRFAYCVMSWPIHKIAHAMGKTHIAVERIVSRRNLKQLRARIDAQIISKGVKGMEKQVEEVTALTTSALKRYLTDIVKSEAPLTPKDAKLISDIGANFHRILQLIKNKPTSITGISPAEMTDELAMESLATILRQAKDDPMFDMERFLIQAKVSDEDKAFLKEKTKDDPFDA